MASVPETSFNRYPEGTINVPMTYIPFGVYSDFEEVIDPYVSEVRPEYKHELASLYTKARELYVKGISLLRLTDLTALDSVSFRRAIKGRRTEYPNLKESYMINQIRMSYLTDGGAAFEVSQWEHINRNKEDIETEFREMKQMWQVLGEHADHEFHSESIRSWVDKKEWINPIAFNLKFTSDGEIGIISPDDARLDEPDNIKDNPVRETLGIAKLVIDKMLENPGELEIDVRYLTPPLSRVRLEEPQQ